MADAWAIVKYIDKLMLRDGIRRDGSFPYYENVEYVTNYGRMRPDLYAYLSGEYAFLAVLRGLHFIGEEKYRYYLDDADMDYPRYPDEEFAALIRSSKWHPHYLFKARLAGIQEAPRKRGEDKEKKMTRTGKK
jgi:hypothetical protein